MTYPPLPVSFYEQDTVKAARNLLGKVVVRRFEDGVVAAGRIVETEAYLVDDPACHAFRGKSRANAAMFGPPGCAYVHINYGLHYCLNAVTQPEGVAEAVLIRAIEPLENAARMLQNYDGTLTDEAMAKRDKRIGAGPGRLTRALSLNKAFDTTDMTSPESPVFLAEGIDYPDEEVVITTRIGITKGADLPYRFYIRDTWWVSRKVARKIAPTLNAPT